MAISIDASGPTVVPFRATQLLVVPDQANFPDDLVEVFLPRAGVAVAVLLGEHDLLTRDALHEVFRLLIAGNDLVVADLSQVQFIDASTLGTFVRADQAARVKGGRFRLQLGADSIVRRVLEITNLVRLLDCAPNRAAALARPPLPVVRSAGGAPAA